MCLMPAAVCARLKDPHDVSLFTAQGPVDARAAGLVDGILADLATRAVVHGQRELALALGHALDALSHVADPARAVA